MKFEKTKLPDHPVIRQAFEAMTDFHSRSPGFHTYAIRAAETLAALAPNADPEAIAACILVPPHILEKVSPQAAAYANQFFKAADAKKPVCASEGAAQVMLANAIVDLEDTREKIAANEFWSAGQAKYQIDKSGKMAEAAAAFTVEGKLAAAAIGGLRAAQNALQEQIDKSEEQAAFRNSGLPYHPTLLAAHELVHNSEKAHDPLFNNKVLLGDGAARVLLETGAASDPDVLGAAQLNQYSRPLPKKLTQAFKKAWSSEDINGTHALIEKYRAEHPDPIEKKFSARLVALYRETSPFYRGHDKMPPTAEGQMIRQAIYVHLLEESLKAYREKQNGKNRDNNAMFGLLEHIEHLKEGLEKSVDSQSHPGLKARLEKAVGAADALMTKPENLKIRKPGTPPREPGW